MEEVRPDRVVVCTDSVAVLESIQTSNTTRECLIIDIQHSLFRLHRGGVDVQFGWVPAHEGVEGNGDSDK